MPAQTNALQALGPQSAVLLLLLLLFAAFTASALTPVAPGGDAAAASQTAQTSQAAAAPCESLYPDKWKIFRCRLHGSSKPQSDCVLPSLVCDGVADCANALDEAGCDFVTSGQEISLRAAAFPDYALNCYCTSRCPFSFFHSCKAAHCPGGRDSGCAYSYARFKIQVLGSNAGVAIRSGDPVGLLYDSGQKKWLSCTAEKAKCVSRKCPGLFSVAQNNQDCATETFFIMLADDSEAARRCLGDPHCVRPPIKRGSRVVLKHAGGLLWAPTEKGKVRVGGCGLFDSEILARAVTDCPNHVWKIFA